MGRVDVSESNHIFEEIARRRDKIDILMSRNFLDSKGLFPQSIAYKKLKPESFSWATDIKLKLIKPDANGYVSYELFSSLEQDFKVGNTSVINIGVGRGKTRTAYKVIEHFAKSKDYVVVLVSPFKKLIQRDEQKLIDRGFKVVNYEVLQTENSEPEKLADANVHIITINSLLLNPGEENLGVTWKKRSYCDSIRNYCKSKNKKVVFVFDEIHAGVHCFQEEFIFNLRAWKDVTHKCYILSATFTEPALIAVEYIAYLTDYKVSIFETERVKFPNQARLHLYVCEQKYSARDLSLLSPLKEIVEKAADENKRVHIVTAFKEMAEKLVDPKSNSELVQTIIKRLDPQLITGDTDTEFNSKASNIGTTFYTGIDLADTDDILVIIFPSAETKYSDKIGGIFTSGKVAIIQAIARMRCNGDIHVFMPSITSHIDGKYLEKYNYFNFISGDPEPFQDDEKQFELLKGFYQMQRDFVEREVQKSEKELLERKDNSTNRASLTYPSLSSFILNKGMTYLVQTFASFGKGFSGYMYWAAINDQFENATLVSLKSVRHNFYQLNLEGGKFREGLLEFYGEDLPNLIDGKDFDESYSILFRQLSFKRTVDGEKKRDVHLSIDDIPITNNLIIPISVKRAIVEILHLVTTGEQTEIDAEQWVRIQIGKALYCKARKKTPNKLIMDYLRLHEIAEEFCNAIRKNGMVAEQSLINDELLKRAFKVMYGINQNDKLIANRVFTFCRLTPTEKELIANDIFKDAKTVQKLRNKVFNSLRSAFTFSEFHKKGASKVERFHEIPKQHFFPDRFEAIKA